MTRPPDLWDASAPGTSHGGGRYRKRWVAAGFVVLLALGIGAAAVHDARSDGGPLRTQASSRPAAATLASMSLVSPARSVIEGAVTPPAATLAPPPSRDDITLVGGRVKFDLVNASATQVLPRLAALTGAKLSGLESLSGTDARISLQGTWQPGREAWQAVLNGTNSILACSGRSCDVWILPAATARPAVSALSSSSDPTEAETQEAETAPASPGQAVAVQPAASPSEQAAEN